MTTLETMRTRFDAHVSEAFPGRNMGDLGVLKLRTDTGQSRRGFIYFPVDTAKLDNATIISATLRFYLAQDWASSSVTIRRVTQEWKESRITYANQPNTTANQEVTASKSGVKFDPIEFDVTAIVQAWVNGRHVRGFRVTTAAATMRKLFSSEGPAAYRPELDIEWADAPEVPEELRPSGEQAVSAAAPLLVWKGEIPTEIQVQIDTTDDFASPVFDSGWVVMDDTEYDTALDPTPPALTDNTTYFWRVNVKNEDGLASGYSEPAEFQRRSKGTLNITVPSAVVEDTTPRVVHTFTGRTQEAVEYVLTEQYPLGVEEIIYVTGKFASTATEFTVPDDYQASPRAPLRKLIKSELATYRIYVRVWDTFKRSATDGFRYVEDVQAFTFEEGPVDPVINLNVGTIDAHLHLTWSRVSVPDYFELVEDGKVVRGYGRVDPVDVAAGGNDYELDYYIESEPRTSHTYKVRAVVDNAGDLISSQTNPEVTATFTPLGIWVTDKELGVEMRILGQQDVAVDIGEAGATFMPIGRRDPVRIIDEVRGFEGSITGALVSAQGRTAEQEREALEALKSEPLNERRLIFAHNNIPVIIGETSLNPSPVPEEVYEISFDFWQVAEFPIRSR